MKLLIALCLLGLVDWSMQTGYCDIGGGLNGLPLDKSSWHDMEDNCYKSLTGQIQRELNASLTYLAMSAHFTTDRYYRPGVAAFFLASASEERSHARALMDYVLVRGLSIASSAIPPLMPQLRWSSIQEALTDALDIEKSVRQNFVDIIKVCEGNDDTKPVKNNDYHAADLLTGTFLQEQHESIRELGGHLATLTKMKAVYKDFAEIMFDKTLLK